MRTCGIEWVTTALVALASSPTLAAAEPPARQPPVLLQMIRNDVVHDELGLSASQVRQVFATLEYLDGPWWRSRILPSEQESATVAELTSQLRRQLDPILDPDQRDRLAQLERQALGTRMFLLEDVAQRLRLDPSTRATLAEAYRETDRQSAKIQKRRMRGELSPDQAAEKLRDLRTAERRAVVAALSSSQRTQIGELTGDAFDFQTIRRSYPRAPEIQPQGSTWLQGGPLELEELRGKVVAIHFYAFQCINCQRNFPHYDAWHQDYSDEGLVVIGIQTPETSAERDAERVETAMKKDGFEYPVLMDAESSNWQAWGNTMWPTVYLVDKEGFIRRWWQGELNWKGANGEQQMRETIEALLAE